MLNLSVTISGDKVVIRGLQSIAAQMPKAVQRGLSQSAKGVHRAAFDFLSGPGGIYEDRVSKKTGNAWRKKVGITPAGGYPVPVRTGNLRRLLDWVPPGATKMSKESKTGKGSGASFTAGLMEAIVYDSALYGRVIHEGRGSSAKFGARPFLFDAFKRFNEAAGVAKAIEEEVRKVIDKRG